MSPEVCPDQLPDELWAPVCPKSVVVEPKAKPLRPQISVNDSCASGAVDRGDRTGLRAIVAAGSSASRRRSNMSAGTASRYSVGPNVPAPVRG